MEYRELLQKFQIENNLPQLDQEKELLYAIGKLFSLFNKSKADIELPHELSRGLQFEKDEIVFFAGTFDPFHQGHQECLAKCPSENIMVMPDRNPWKKGQGRESSELETYLNLLKTTQYCVYPGFLSLEESNPTVDWITKVHVKNKFLLMGADTFMDLPKWKNPDVLLKNLQGLYVLSRQVDHQLILDRAESLKSKYKNLKIEFIEDNPYEELSSTELRNNVGITKK
jgi:nicotinate-nucleotide adenylyltransferase